MQKIRPVEMVEKPPFKEVLAISQTGANSLIV